MSSEPFFRRLSNGIHRRVGRRAKRPLHRATARLSQAIETLEDRSLLSATYLPINTAGAADPTGLAALGGQVLFAADDGTHGVELWKSDGTISGTTLVKDINPGTTLSGGVATPNSSNPTDLTAVGGYVYFAATDGSDGVQLWRSDGTAAGTVMITDLNVAGGGISPTDLINANGKLNFVANDGTDGNQVWTTDGTSGGTVMISNLQPTSGAADPAQLIAVGNNVFFTASTDTGGVQLYATDGTLTGTHLVSNVSNGSVGASPTYLSNVNGTLFYAGYDSTHGNQLWQSNGTASGTRLAAVIGSGTSSSNPTNLTDVNGTLYFAANDGTHGVQLWSLNATTGSAQMVSDINTTATGASAYPADLTNVNGVLYFRADDGVHGSQLWRTDGTTAGTTMVATINSGAVGATPDNLIAANGYVFFTANDGVHGFELWQSDGTAAGTSLLADINPGAPSSNPALLTVAGNNLLVAANDGTHGVSLYAAPIPAAKPTVANSSYGFTPGETLSVAAPGVLTGATSASGTTLTAVLVSGPSHGTLTLNADGSFSYTPAAGFDGKDSFVINASDGTHTAAQPAIVTVQSLDYRWVSNLYTDVLGRPAGDETDGEVSFWMNQLASGLTRLQVAEIFAHSSEYYSRLVNGYYEQILQHPADPTGLNYFVGELLAGASESTVVSQIISSSEFLALSGTLNGYASNLYSVLLGRLPSASDFSYWSGLLNGGLAPRTAAEDFTASSEYQSDLVQSLYEQYLNRPVDSVALQDWLWAIQHGATPQSITAALVSSDEFYNA